MLTTQAVAALAWPCRRLPPSPQGLLQPPPGAPVLGLQRRPRARFSVPLGMDLQFSYCIWNSASFSPWVSLSPQVPEGLPTHAALSLPLSVSLSVHICMSQSPPFTLSTSPFPFPLRAPQERTTTTERPGEQRVASPPWPPGSRNLPCSAPDPRS